MVNSFLVITSDYDSFTIGLCVGNSCIDHLSDATHKISRNLVPMLINILDKNSICLDSLKFVAVNCGPGPFTTLRSIIASTNGLSFATKVPLVEVDGIKALLLEHSSPLFPITIALFNAFNNDLYFGIKVFEKEVETGYKNQIQFLTDLSKKYPEQTIRFIGSGVDLYQATIIEFFKTWAFIPDPLPKTASIQQISKIGLEQFVSGLGISNQLKPLYLKNIY